MKSHPSISPVSRALIAATAVFAVSSIAVNAQSTSGSSPSQGSSSGSSWQSGQSGTSTSSSSYSPSTSGSYQSSGSAGTSGTSQMGTSDTDMSSSRMTQQQQPYGSSTSSQKLSWGDRRFVTKAADDGQEELQLAQLAAQKAQNPDVKSYAQQLVQGHQRVNQELMSIANQRNVKIDKEDSQSRIYRRLNNASSQEFDREFVEHMVDQHEKDVKLFEKAASDAKDPQIKQFASRHVSALRQHLQQAQRLQQSVIPTGDEESSGQSWRSQSSQSGQSGQSGSSSYGSGSSDTSSSGTGSSSSYGSGSSTGTTTYGSGSTGSTPSSTGTTR